MTRKIAVFGGLGAVQVLMAWLILFGVVPVPPSRSLGFVAYSGAGIATWLWGLRK